MRQGLRSCANDMPKLTFHSVQTLRQCKATSCSCICVTCSVVSLFHMQVQPKKSNKRIFLNLISGFQPEALHYYVGGSYQNTCIFL